VSQQDSIDVPTRNIESTVGYLKNFTCIDKIQALVESRNLQFCKLITYHHSYPDELNYNNVYGI